MVTRHQKLENNLLKGKSYLQILVAKNASKTYTEQQLDVTDFVESLDRFLTKKIELEREPILKACIEHPKLKFVVDIDPKTKLETEVQERPVSNSIIPANRNHSTQCHLRRGKHISAANVNAQMGTIQRHVT